MRHNSPDEAVAPLVADLVSTWQSPCLAHVARFFPPPQARTFAEFRELWYGGTLGVAAMIGGVYVRDGHRWFVVPPSTPAESADALARKLASRLCAAGERCSNAMTFVARANDAFDAAEARATSWQDRRGWCTDDASLPFEDWARCIARAAPRSHRYPALPFRAPERGWLVMHGRRGHFKFADEVRAYDLSSGAAWVARSESALVLDDRGATSASRKREVFTGRVAPGVARELAFVLETVGAPQATRRHLILVPLPERLEVRLSPHASLAAFDAPEDTWGNDAQTSIGWALVDGGKMIDDGRFTWPDSSNAGEHYADAILRQLEAGLERGCAPARLPARFGSSFAFGASPIDADDAELVKVGADLEAALVRLAAAPGSVCPP